MDDIRPIPKKSNVTLIHYPDWFHSDFYCPFCGTRSIKMREGEFVAQKCPHLVFVERVCAVIFASDELVAEIRKISPQSSADQIRDCGFVAWPDAQGWDWTVPVREFCCLIDNSLTIISEHADTGDDVVVCYRPA
jgi:hypothetical protein